MENLNKITDDIIEFSGWTDGELDRECRRLEIWITPGETRDKKRGIQISALILSKYKNKGT